MSLKRVILHIGMGKTGTSTIQDFLNRNSHTLCANGFLTFDPNALDTFRQPDFENTERLLSGLEELISRCKKASADSVIWSMEALGTRQFASDRQRVEAIRDKLDAEDFKVIVYVRRQDYFAQSGYLQWGIVHKTYPGPVRSFQERWPSIVGMDGSSLPDTNFNYYAVMQPWAKVFGRENVMVRPFEKSQWKDGKLLQDFVAHSAIPPLDYDFDISHQNKTFNMELHEMFRMYNSVFEEAIFPAEMNRFFYSFSDDEFFQRPFFSRYKLPSKDRIEILKACEEFNAKVAREYLGWEDGVLFHEPWPSLDEPFHVHEDLTLEKLVPILMQILLHQHRRLTHLEQQQGFNVKEFCKKFLQENSTSGHSQKGFGRSLFRKLFGRIFAGKDKSSTGN